ncbi:MAG: DUF1295 domain-containing protein [Proteobacteria bacterium]|nr:DUF1295 domain-containing protein [Pseudomonadota bacterium]
MIDCRTTLGIGLAGTCVLAVVVWLISVKRHDVSIVDSAWSLLVLVPPLTAAARLPAMELRGKVVLVLAGAWALRLSAHITRRHRGEPEDRRYREIRARNEPHFAVKSLYLVFGLQAVLAWVVALPLVAAVAGAAAWRPLDAAGSAWAVFGIVFEAVADAQLARFKADPAQRGRVMAQGLWRYTRHPNYFGEFCIWWGVWLCALSAGAAWTVLSPLLMSALLLRVSGVTLLERDIAERRPGYREYVRRTNAFFPGRPRP